MRQTLLWIVWLGLIAYILLFAPPIQADTFQPLQTLFSGQLPTVNPVMIALFSLIGIWLLIYSCLIFADGRMQDLPAWAFMLAAMGTGVLGLIPYLAMRQSNQEFSGEKDAWLALMDARSTGVILTISTAILLAYGLLFGDWAAFVYEFQTNRFVNGMSLAFCLFCLLFPYPTLWGDDRARRGLSAVGRTEWLTWIPLFGPLVYLCRRPALRQPSLSQTIPQPTLHH
nr:MAG: hypothetical protein EDM05_15630 [Leptolyngbya sp. IPPAS B-1204]